ncbi:molybdenum cofactor guanylyltransferase [Xylophilus sp. Kf1]|nr:molybdenum cofactor guanylyltransferase [Xylophilus sp. Kf1]
MNGVDKGLVVWEGSPLAWHALRRLESQVTSVAVNANRNADIYAGWQVPVWPDADGSFSGPLAGLLAGLTHCRTDWLVTVPCDSPLFPTDLVSRLARATADAGARVAMAATVRPNGGTDAQPVFMLVHRSLRRSVVDALERDEHQVRRWAKSQACATAVFDDAAAFANANTVEDLAALPVAR